MKLTPKQKEVIQKMREGVEFYHNPVTGRSPYTEGAFGATARPISGTIILSLEKRGLIVKGRINVVMYKYSLTKLGKTIEL